jgi:putative nucleotidyltransferase with HDIG domain
VTLHVMGEKFSGVESYSHSLNVSVLCMMLSKGLGLTPEQARVLGLGALLHDIGLAEVPDRVLKKRPDEYTKPERDLRAMHCEFGLRIGKQLGLSPEVLAIIFQHHEMADGTGYPTGAKLDKIAFPARVVALVNCYDNLCNPADLAQAMTPHEALSFMFGQRRASSTRRSCSR